jgi:hypothetical protein
MGDKAGVEHLRSFTAIDGKFVSPECPFFISGYIESALVLFTLVECGRQVLPGLIHPQDGSAQPAEMKSMAHLMRLAR